MDALGRAHAGGLRPVRRRLRRDGRRPDSLTASAYDVESPDGRRWQVRVAAVRLPRWYESRFDWFVLPLVRGIALLPFALLRPLLSTTRWVEAVCLGPPRREIVWRTTRADGRRVAAEIVARLKDGHALEVAGSTLESVQ